MRQKVAPKRRPTSNGSPKHPKQQPWSPDGDAAFYAQRARSLAAELTALADAFDRGNKQCIDPQTIDRCRDALYFGWDRTRADRMRVVEWLEKNAPPVRLVASAGQSTNSRESDGAKLEGFIAFLRAEMPNRVKLLFDRDVKRELVPVSNLADWFRDGFAMILDAYRRGPGDKLKPSKKNEREWTKWEAIRRLLNPILLWGWQDSSGAFHEGPTVESIETDWTEWKRLRRQREDRQKVRSLT